MPLTGKQAGGRIKPDPAGTGQIDLRPGVQIGKILRGAGGAFDRHDVGGELDQVARDEPRRVAEMAQQLNQ